jgi:bromodomain adjacent to zinc finger domain protein 1A
MEFPGYLWVSQQLQMVTYVCLTVCRRQPLHLSTFTMDEFEHALRHSLVDPPCALLGEIHSTLIYNLRTVPFTRHSAVLSLLRLQDTLEEDHRVLGVSVDELAGAMADVGNNWERIPLRHTEMRDGWEEALLGCLKDVE